MTELWTLAASAFLAATLLPGGSEVYLLYLLNEGAHAPWLLVAVATVGNSLGSMTSWAIGRWLPQSERFETQYARALAWLRRYGAVAMLMAWVPIVGDPLCVAAGWLRLPFIPVLILTTLGKAARYAVLAVWF